MEPENKGTYTETQKKSIQKYRETHRDQYNEYQRELYQRQREQDLERMRALKREQQRRYYAKKRAERAQTA